MIPEEVRPLRHSMSRVVTRSVGRGKEYLSHRITPLSVLVVYYYFGLNVSVCHFTIFRREVVFDTPSTLLSFYELCPRLYSSEIDPPCVL